jgi:hypothetical protein
VKNTRTCTTKNMDIKNIKHETSLMRVLFWIIKPKYMKMDEEVD